MPRNKSIVILAVATTGISPVFAEAPTTPLAVDVGSSAINWGGCPPIFPGACAMTVVQGDPGKPNADVVLRVGPGNTLPRHKHSSAERMILLKGRMSVKYDGAPVAILNPSNYAYGPAGLPHVATCQSKTPCVLFIAFEGPVDAELVQDHQHKH